MALQMAFKSSQVYAAQPSASLHAALKPWIIRPPPFGAQQLPTTHRPAWSLPLRATPSEIDLDALLGDLDMPEIDADLASVQTDSGAIFGDNGVPFSFGKDGYALEAIETGVALIDRSNWGRLRLSGPDRLTFLHSQSTASLAALTPGSGAETVLVTPQARAIDIATVYAQGAGALMVVSPGMGPTVRERLDKYIFIGDDVQVKDISGITAMFSVLGPGSDAVMQELGAGELVGLGVGAHAVFGVQGKPVIAAVGGGLPGTGYTLIVEESAAADLWKSIAAKDTVPMGTRAWEIARVLAGRPAPGAELTDEYNPLEAGLYGAVSLNKGCYIGQETLAKVHTQGALRRELWGLELDAPVSVGAAVSTPGGKGKPLGKVTSYVDTVQMDHRALAMLRCKGEGGARVALEGTKVDVEGVSGRVVRLPYAQRQFSEGCAPPEGAAAKQTAREEEDVVARREAKLKQMQAQLAAWQAQQQGGQ